MNDNVKTYSKEDFVKLLQDPAKVDAFLSLFNAAACIVGDFDLYGDLQANEGGMFNETTDIEKLRGAIHLIRPGLVSEGDYLPWLSTAQQKKLQDVATEVFAAGDGVVEIDESSARVEVETMTPYERLQTLRDDHDWRCKRLGFDPDTGQDIKS